MIRVWPPVSGQHNPIPRCRLLECGGGWRIGQTGVIVVSAQGLRDFDLLAGTDVVEGD